MKSSHSARRAGGILLATMLLEGCVSDPDSWAFGISRHAYSESFFKPNNHYLQDSGRHTQAEATGYLIFLALPMAIDILLLPVTLVHDLIYMD